MSQQDSLDRSKPLFFVSYARNDASDAESRKQLVKFVEHLRTQVALTLGVPNVANNIRFFDEFSVENGAIWDSVMSSALLACKVGVALYSPSYFASRYCGKEFHTYWMRKSPDPEVPGIVPVIWRKVTEMPTSAKKLQFNNAALPPDYHQLGVSKLMSLGSYRDKYKITRDALAEQIVKGIRANALRRLDMFDIQTAPSAWDEDIAADPDSHTRGGINKTCFVFVSESGPNWTPYPGSRNSERETIGATARWLSGDLGLGFEELPCDAELLRKLKETRNSNVPTLIIADPHSVIKQPFSDLMRSYDDVYYLNCGTLVPWKSSEAISDDSLRILSAIFHQKLKTPPPHHEWSTVFSQDALEAKTRDTIEDIRLTLMQDTLAGRSSVHQTVLSKAVNSTIVADAAIQGIEVDTLPQVHGPTRLLP